MFSVMYNVSLYYGLYVKSSFRGKAASFLPRRLASYSQTLQVRLAAAKVALGEVSLRALLSFSLLHKHIRFNNILIIRIFASGRSLVQRSPTNCDVYEGGLESSKMGAPWPIGGGGVVRAKTIYICFNLTACVM